MPVKDVEERDGWVGLGWGWRGGRRSGLSK